MSEAVLNRADSDLPDREAALARFAVTLTAEPWSLTPATAEDLAAQGFDATAIEAATGVVAMFNYLTRVADASGIEFDYATPLPAFRPERQRRPVDRPDRDSWPVLGAEYRTFPLLPALTQAWDRWREYVFDSDEPLTRRQREVVALVAAQECCDRWAAEQLSSDVPSGDAEVRLVAFARKLSRSPWQMEPADLDGLRGLGLSDRAVLHVIAVVAFQNAESRVALGRGLL